MLDENVNLWGFSWGWPIKFKRLPGYAAFFRWASGSVPKNEKKPGLERKI